MNKPMLIIPGAFVPANDTVTLLTYRRLKHLDLEKDVLALKQVKDPYIEKQLSKDKYYKSFNIEYCMDYENTICIKHPSRLPIGLINMQRYISKAYKKSKQKHYDYLYTSSIPGISHICGYKIKKHNPNIIWYASFSDPIKNAPYKKDPFLKKRGLLYRLMFKVGSYVYMNNKYEEVAIKHADKLIFICEEQRDFTANQYPEYKQSIIDRSIILGLHYDDDWDSIKADNTKSNAPLKAIHVGRIYGLRKIDKFLEALKEIKQEDNNISNKIVFHQYGEIQPEYIDYIKNNHLEDIFIIHKSIPYGEVLKEMQNSDILVIFDTIQEEGIQPYLPSKIAEYAAIQKQILGICNRNSPLNRLLSSTNHATCINHKETIIETINNLISKRETGYGQYICDYELKIQEDNEGIVLGTNIYISNNVHELLQAANYEKVLLNILNDSKIIFTGTYNGNSHEKQSHGECDFIETKDGERREIDVKLLFSSDMCRSTDPKKPDINNFVDVMTEMLNEIFECAGKDNYCEEMRKTFLYQIMYNIFLKNAKKAKAGKNKEDILFFFPFPISGKLEGSLAFSLGRDNFEMVFDRIEDDHRDLVDNINVYLIINNQNKGTVIYNLKSSSINNHEYINKNYFKQYVN